MIPSNCYKASGLSATECHFILISQRLFHSNLKVATLRSGTGPAGSRAHSSLKFVINIWKTARPNLWPHRNYDPLHTTVDVFLWWLLPSLAVVPTLFLTSDSLPPWHGVSVVDVVAPHGRQRWDPAKTLHGAQMEETIAVSSLLGCSFLSMVVGIGDIVAGVINGFDDIIVGSENSKNNKMN